MMAPTTRIAAIVLSTRIIRACRGTFGSFFLLNRINSSHLLQRTEKIEHNPVELFRPLHIQRMSYVVHDYLPGTRDALFKLLYDAQHLAHILVADDQTGGDCNFAQACDSRGFQFLRRGKLRGSHVSVGVQVHLIDSLANSRVYLLRRAFGAIDPYSG